ncbi:hypothetical protein BKA81DRAFT_364490 [Phyllosticta paracitricarpa]
MAGGAVLLVHLAFAVYVRQAMGHEGRFLVVDTVSSCLSAAAVAFSLPCLDDAKQSSDFLNERQRRVSTAAKSASLATGNSSSSSSLFSVWLGSSPCMPG